MNVNELRIGNYFKTNSETHKVLSIEWYELDEKYYIYSDDGCCVSSLDDLIPIPLTEEILLKCGAEYLGFVDEFNEIKEYDLNYGVKVDFYVKINEFDVYYCNNIIECCDDNEIKLHELQNLYFVLTKKELKINL